MSTKPTASLSLDLDNLWTYMKVHGDKHWEEFPTYLPTFVPIALDFFGKWNQKITFFVVGQDALRRDNHDPLRQIIKSGHEIGNHSLSHEPWMQNYGEARVVEEISKAENAISEISGTRPIGFRGPGYSRSATMLKVLADRGYTYDTSMLPSILGPLARMYYFWGTKVAKENRDDRADLFGHVNDGFLPLKPFLWNTVGGNILEIPVTTMPVFRVPFHLSYLLWLSRYSKGLAKTYFRFALILCRIRGVEPCYLLHPLDFLGQEDVKGLGFFPGMDLSRAHKMEMADAFMQIYREYFHVVPVLEHAQSIRARGRITTREWPSSSNAAPRTSAFSESKP